MQGLLVVMTVLIGFGLGVAGWMSFTQLLHVACSSEDATCATAACRARALPVLEATIALVVGSWALFCAVFMPGTCLRERVNYRVILGALLFGALLTVGHLELAVLASWSADCFPSDWPRAIGGSLAAFVAAALVACLLLMHGFTVCPRPFDPDNFPPTASAASVSGDPADPNAAASDMPLL